MTSSGIFVIPDFLIHMLKRMCEQDGGEGKFV